MDPARGDKGMETGSPTSSPALTWNSTATSLVSAACYNHDSNFITACDTTYHSYPDGDVLPTGTWASTHTLYWQRLPAMQNDQHCPAANPIASLASSDPFVWAVPTDPVTPSITNIHSGGEPTGWPVDQHQGRHPHLGLTFPFPQEAGVLPSSSLLTGVDGSSPLAPWSYEISSPPLIDSSPPTYLGPFTGGALSPTLPAPSPVGRAPCIPTEPRSHTPRSLTHPILGDGRNSVKPAVQPANMQIIPFVPEATTNQKSSRKRSSIDEEEHTRVAPRTLKKVTYQNEKGEMSGALITFGNPERQRSRLTPQKKLETQLARQEGVCERCQVSKKKVVQLESFLHGAQILTPNWTV